MRWHDFGCVTFNLPKCIFSTMFNVQVVACVNMVEWTKYDCFSTTSEEAEEVKSYHIIYH